MAIPLFNGSVGSSIAPSGIGDLNLPNAYLQGIKAGQAVPSTATAIAEGVTGAVKLNQELTLNQQQIDNNAVDLENKQQLAPEALEAQKLQIQNKQEEYAQQIKLRQKEEAFQAIFSGQDPQAKVQAVTSGQFADLFAVNPNLETYAVKVAAPNMSDEEQDSFVRNKTDDLLNRQLKLDGIKTVQKADEDISGFTQSSLASRVLAENPQLQNNPLTLLDSKRYAFVPSGTYSTDPRTGQRAVDLQGNIVKNQVDLSTGRITFDLVDNQANKIISTGVLEDERKQFDAAIQGKANKQRVEGTYRNNPISIVQDFQKLRKAEREASPTPQQGTPSLPGQPVSISNTKKDIEKVAVVPTSSPNKTEVNPVVAALVAKSFGLKDEHLEKATPQIQGVLSDYLQYDINEASGKNKLDREADYSGYLKNRKEKVDAQRSTVKTILAERFKQNEDLLKGEYNQQAVDAHNKAYRDYKKAGGNGFPFDIDPSKMRGIFMEISSPEQLYVEANFQREGEKLLAQMDSTALTYKNQTQQKLSSGQINTKVIQQVDKFLK